MYIVNGFCKHALWYKKEEGISFDVRAKLLAITCSDVSVIFVPRGTKNYTRTFQFCSNYKIKYTSGCPSR